MNNLKLKLKAVIFLFLFLIFFIAGCIKLPTLINKFIIYKNLSDSTSSYSANDIRRTAELLLNSDIIFNSAVRNDLDKKLSEFPSYIGLYSGFDNNLTGDFYHSKTGNYETIKFNKVPIYDRNGETVYSYRANYDQNKLESISTSMSNINDSYKGLFHFSIKEGKMFSSITTDDGIIPIVVGGAAMENVVKIGDKATITVNFRINDDEIEPIILPCQIVGILEHCPLVYSSRNQSLLPLTYLQLMDSIVLLPDIYSKIPSEADVLSYNGAQRRCLIIFEPNTNIFDLLNSLNQAIGEYGIVSSSESLNQTNIADIWLNDFYQSSIPIYTMISLTYIVALVIIVIICMSVLYQSSNRSWIVLAFGIFITTMAALVTFLFITKTSLFSNDLLIYGLFKSFVNSKQVIFVLTLFLITVISINHIRYINKTKRSRNHD